MLIQVEAEGSSNTTQAVYRRALGWLPSSRPRTGWIVFAFLFLTTLALQIASGAYRSEFGAYPDEPAHYVTSIMVREFITSGHWLHPVAFAQAYYQHYPKVALGHWPPVFYIVQSAWMLVFSASRTSVRLEILLTTVVLAFSFYSEARRTFGTRAGLLGAVLLVCVPVMQMCTDEEMAESLLILFCFWATVYFARFLNSQSWKNGAYFGLFLSLAVLTKGNGWLLCGVPPIAIVLTRKWRILRTGTFWLSVLIVIALCLPWQLLTLHAAEQGWGAGPHPSLEYTRSALAGFGRMLISVPGPVLAALMILGLLAEIALPVVRHRAVKVLPAAMFALLVATVLFHSAVPAGVEDRKLALALPAMLLFVLWGGFWLADRLPLPVGVRRIAVTAVAVAAFLLGTFSIPHDVRYGYMDAARFLTSQPEFRNATILTSSNSDGEGLLTSEVAMRCPRPAYRIVRATKAMADVDWGGRNYRTLVKNTQDVLHVLDDRGIQIVAVDDIQAPNEFAHHVLLWQAIRENPSRFQAIATFVSNDKAALGSRVVLYRYHAS